MRMQNLLVYLLDALEPSLGLVDEAKQALGDFDPHVRFIVIGGAAGRRDMLRGPRRAPLHPSLQSNGSRMNGHDCEEKYVRLW